MSGGFFSPPRVNRAVDGWEQRSLRSMLSTRSERNRADLPLLTVARERGVFVRSEDDANHNAIPEDLSNYKVARSGDLVINKMKAWQGSLGLAPVDGIVSPAYFVFSADFAVPEFGEYLLRSKPYVAKFAAASDGVRIGQWDLDIARMREIRVSLPAAEEQAAIVKYLAHANARIDKAIAAKCRLVALLEEQKKVMVEDLVFGANSDRRDSGVAWLGDVPAHWEVASARHTFRAVSRIPKGDEPKLSVTQEHGLVNTNLMQENSTQAKSLEGFQACVPGDMVLNKYKAHLGVFWGASKPGLITPNYTVFWQIRPINVEYFELLFRSQRYLRGFSEVVYGVTDGMSPLYVKDFYRLPLVSPPLHEQVNIVTRSRHITSGVQRASAKLSREITLLQEFRNRLVADVVTGQVDVRAIALTLPDAPESVGEPFSELDDELLEALDEGEG